MTPIKHNLVALGSAAVVAVYAAGYERTRSAAQRFATEAANRRPPPATPRPAPGESAATTISEPLVVDTTAAPTASPTKHDDAPSHAARTTPRHSDSTSTSAAAPAEAVVTTATTPTPDSSAKTAPAQATDSAAQRADSARSYKDGTYSGWGTSRHGDIEASVLIKDGRIAAAIISQCLTRYSCSWISELPGQVVARQSPEVDYVSGATQSTNAFYYAVVEALKKAK